MPLWVVLLSSGLAASDSRSYGFPSGKACGTAVNLGLPTSPGANLSAPLDVLRTLASQPSTLLCNNGHGLLIAPYPFDYCDHGSAGNNSQLQSSNAGSNPHAGISTAAQHAARSTSASAHLARTTAILLARTRAIHAILRLFPSIPSRATAVSTARYSCVAAATLLRPISTLSRQFGRLGLVSNLALAPTVT
jgi:hypothetical protein